MPIVIIGLLPSALKNLDYKISKKTEFTTNTFALIGLTYLIMVTFF